MPQVDEFIDNSATTTGTALVAATLDTAVSCNSMLVSGGIPVTNGTLTLTQPATSVIYNPGGTAALRAFAASAPLTFTASRDTYVDLSSGGSYTLAAVTNGAGAPAVTANSVRLYKAVSGGSAVTAITQLATGQPLDPTAVSAADETASNDALTPASSLTNTFHRIFFQLSQLQGIPTQSGIQVDAVEAATLDTLSGGSLLSNMDRLRFVIAANMLGLTWSQTLANTKRAVLSDGTNAAATINFPSGATIGGATPMLGDGTHASNPNLDHGDTTTVFNLVVNGSISGAGATSLNKHRGLPILSVTSTANTGNNGSNFGGFAGTMVTDSNDYSGSFNVNYTAQTVLPSSTASGNVQFHVAFTNAFAVAPAVTVSTGGWQTALPTPGYPLSVSGTGTFAPTGPTGFAVLVQAQNVTTTGFDIVLTLLVNVPNAGSFAQINGPLYYQAIGH